MHYGEVLVDKSAIDLILRVLDYIELFNLGTSCTVFVLTCTVVVLNCFLMRGCVDVWVL